MPAPTQRERAALHLHALVVAASLGGCGEAAPEAADGSGSTIPTVSEATGDTPTSGDSSSDSSSSGSSDGDTTGGLTDCESIQAALQDVADAHVEAGVVGLVLAARTPQCPPIAVASGVAELASEAPLTVDHRLRIGSVTKTVTAALLLRLQEDGLVDLDAPISDYVDTPVPKADEISVRQLLNHTSGIANYLNSPNFFDIADGVRVWEPAELVQLGVDLGPVFDPGQGWEYSNTNYIIAGLIAEAVTGQTFGQAVRATILDPAGLDETYFDGEETVEGELAHGYIPGEDLTFSHHPSAAWAAGAMVMTVGDLAAWTDALLRGPLLSDASKEEMLDVVATGNPETPYYGLGVEMPSLDVGAVVGHGGLFPGYTAAMGLRVDSDDVVVAISNTFGYFYQWDAVKYGLLALDEARSS
ncbi:serine hydrolase domain-containing protein [Nannocystis sp.]|uniref:serine hydrolase domain-containing protein n=1 Tax=Nannocystis sp. TaxID=1962667 RepID=UPI0025EECC24|nr:serine hydrolase domain-containing protein [Nannocystis sp.]MBK7829492.1 beta-lactamase family protein [Nannocystis sp.]